MPALSSPWIRWVPRATVPRGLRTWRKRRVPGKGALACLPPAASQAPGAMMWAWTAGVPPRGQRPGPGPSTTTVSSRAACSKQGFRRPRTAARCPAQVPGGSQRGGEGGAPVQPVGPHGQGQPHPAVCWYCFQGHCSLVSVGRQTPHSKTNTPAPKDTAVGSTVHRLLGKRRVQSRAPEEPSPFTRHVTPEILWPVHSQSTRQSLPWSHCADWETEAQRHPPTHTQEPCVPQNCGQSAETLFPCQLLLPAPGTLLIGSRKGAPQEEGRVWAGQSKGDPR